MARVQKPRCRCEFQIPRRLESRLVYVGLERRHIRCELAWKPGKAALRLFRASVRSYKHRKWDRDWGVPSRRRAVLVEKEGCSERLQIHSDGCSFTAPKHVGEATPRSASFMFPSTSLYKWTLLATGRRTAHASSRKLPPLP